MKFNPLALIFWGICCCVGYLLNDITGLVAGLLVGLSLSLIAGLRA